MTWVNDLTEGLENCAGGVGVRRDLSAMGGRRIQRPSKPNTIGLDNW